MKTAKELATIFNNMNPDEQVWCIWVDRDELINIINDSEMTDSDDNLITADRELVTEDFLYEVMSSVDSAEYVWDRFNEELNETTRDKFNDLLEEQEEDKDLWDKEQDNE